MPPPRAPCRRDCWWIFPLHTADNNEALGQACPMGEVCHHWKPQKEMGLRTREQLLRQCRKWKPSENRHHSRPPLGRGLGGRRCLRIARYLCRVCSVLVGWRQWEGTISAAGGPETGGVAGAACAVPTLGGPLSLLGAGAPPAGWSPGLRPLPDRGSRPYPPRSRSLPPCCGGFPPLRGWRRKEELCQEKSGPPPFLEGRESCACAHESFRKLTHLTFPKTSAKLHCPGSLKAF